MPNSSDLVKIAVNADEVTDAPFHTCGADLLERTGLSGRVFFDKSHKQYWMQGNSGEWEGCDARTFSAYLKFVGYCPVVRNDVQEKISELDHVLAHILLNCSVAWAGELAGFRRGMIDNNRNQILVTKSFAIPAIEKGTMEDFQTIMDLINQQLSPNVDDPLDQVQYLLGWWKHSIESLEYGYEKNLGMCLVFAGSRGCGKSLLKDLIKESLGGRECQPYSYLSGRDNFNGEFLKSECWFVDDDQSSTDARVRDEIGAKIKKIVADKVFHVRGKHVEAMDIKLYRRLVMCVNDEPERLLVLPLLTDDIIDKILILHCHAPGDLDDPMPMPVQTPEEQDEFWAQLQKELPYFMGWLLNEYKIPEELYGRFGIKHFQHPDIKRALFDLSPEVALMDIIERALFKDLNKKSWQYGTTSDLRAYLIGEAAPLTVKEKSSVKSIQWLGRQLTRIASEHPDRYVQRRSHDGSSRYWFIAKNGCNLIDITEAMADRVGQLPDSNFDYLSD